MYIITNAGFKFILQMMNLVQELNQTYRKYQTPYFMFNYILTCCRSRPVCVTSLPVFNIFSTAELICFDGFLSMTFFTWATDDIKELKLSVKKEYVTADSEFKDNYS